MTMYTMNSRPSTAVNASTTRPSGACTFATPSDTAVTALSADQFNSATTASATTTTKIAHVLKFIVAPRICFKQS